jgi:hypothetical protein
MSKISDCRATLYSFSTSSGEFKLSDAQRRRAVPGPGARYRSHGSHRSTEPIVVLGLDCKDCARLLRLPTNKATAQRWWFHSLLTKMQHVTLFSWYYSISCLSRVPIPSSLHHTWRFGRSCLFQPQDQRQQGTVRLDQKPTCRRHAYLPARGLPCYHIHFRVVSRHAPPLVTRPVCPPAISHLAALWCTSAARNLVWKLGRIS